MKKIALLFVGQGSQYPGMGMDIYEKYGFVREMFQEAGSILGYDLAELCFLENERLNQTIYTQPAITVLNCALFEILRAEGIKFHAALGFSLGEYSALYAAGVFNFPTAIDLIKQRALYMHRVAEKTGGAMTAIIGLDLEAVKAVCAASGTAIANFNSPIQYVIAGEEERVKAAEEEARRLGARRVVRLNVSGAFHHPLMREAAENLKPHLQAASKNPPAFPVVMNFTASPLEIEEIEELLEKQIYSPVRFEESVRRLVEMGSDGFIEVGPGRVLSGLVKRIAPEVETYNFEKLSDLIALKEAINESEK
ncbi:MAG TPA: ACP S-malonyltransferase [Acholeplasmataceae bacterium]|nr:ACP S-malonyltransferase [Acholeplasmataceae bacterium]